MAKKRATKTSAARKAGKSAGRKPLASSNRSTGARGTTKKPSARTSVKPSNKTPASPSKNWAESSSQATSAELRPRRLKPASYKSFRLQKKVVAAKPPIASGFRIFGRSAAILARNWPIFVGIIVIFGLLSVLTGGLSAATSSNIGQIKHQLSQSLGSFSTGLGLFAYLGGSSGLVSSPAGGTAQSLLLIFISLAMIWALRQAYAKEPNAVLRVRDAFYHGMSSMVQFILVVIVLLLELIPLTVGALLFATVVNGGIAVTAPEKSIFGVIFFLLAVASFYMLTSSIFAPYIVTLDGMTPVKALRAAAGVARLHRGRIFIKLLFLVVALIVISAILTIPLALFATKVAPYVFFVLTLIYLAFFHSYVYALYREMI